MCICGMCSIMCICGMQEPKTSLHACIYVIYQTFGSYRIGNGICTENGTLSVQLEFLQSVHIFVINIQIKEVITIFPESSPCSLKLHSPLQVTTIQYFDNILICPLFPLLIKQNHTGCIFLIPSFFLVSEHNEDLTHCKTFVL